MNGEFSVYQFFEGDVGYERVASYIDAESAVKLAAQLSRSVGGRLGIIARIIITDSGDAIAFEWLHGQGVVYPLRVPEGENQ